MIRTKKVITDIPEVKQTLAAVMACYEKKIKPDTPPEIERRIRERISHLKTAAEAVEVFNPIELHNNQCQSCGREFTDNEISDCKFYYCPQCGQALIDWLDSNIVDDISSEVSGTDDF